MSNNPAKPLWTDAENRTWSTAVTVNTIKRVKDLVGVNLLEVFDGALLNQLADDPILLVNTLYAVSKPQAEERGITEEQFGELLVGDTIAEAAAGASSGISDFFPSDRRTVLQRLWKATSRTRSRATELATAKLDSPLIDQVIDTALQQVSDEIDRRLKNFGEPSGSLPAVSELTPAA